METCIIELGTRDFHFVRSCLGATQDLEVLEHVTERVALDSSIDATGSIGRRARADALRTFGRFVSMARKRRPSQRVLAVAPHTAAYNLEDFFEAVWRRYGVTVDVMSVDRMARLTYRAVRHELGTTPSSIVVAHLGSTNLNLAWGSGAHCDSVKGLSLGVGRLHHAHGSGAHGMLACSGRAALFTLTRLSGGPVARRLRLGGDHALVVCSDNAAALREVARAWGYLEADDVTLGRIVLHALVSEVLAAPLSSLCRLGLEPRRAALVGTSAVILDALADLLGQREVRFARCGLREGLALLELSAVHGPDRLQQVAP